VVAVQVAVSNDGEASPLYLPYVSPISPLDRTMQVAVGDNGEAQVVREERLGDIVRYIGRCRKI
jgi:hypothetical protein